MNHSFSSTLASELFRMGVSNMRLQSEESPSRECCGCFQLFPEAKLQVVNANESACPECHREIMRDFRACDE